MIQVIAAEPTPQSARMAVKSGIGTYIWPVASRAARTKKGRVRPVWARAEGSPVRVRAGAAEWKVDIAMGRR
ncbi:hypothetical protein IFM12276_58670 [Nocardia sputorum]|uniref:DUF1905 domain-containing protein n=1 Tax=Nocardia sputorum TaxID=2984338 RepID=A0ABM8D5X6_9NOCA|nr:hypothetical protein IFM12276_58670 [Nocardia sputorum]